MENCSEKDFFALRIIFFLRFIFQMSSLQPSSEGSTIPPQSSQGRITIKDLCCLFCCPPLPSSIVSKLAFMPPESSYRIVQHDSQRLFLIYSSSKTNCELSSFYQAFNSSYQSLHVKGFFHIFTTFSENLV